MTRTPAALAILAALTLLACPPAATSRRPPATPTPTATPTPAPTPTATPTATSKRGGTVTVRFLDVGQGDSALITTSDRHAMLVDAGPPEGAARVDAALRELGDVSLEAVVLSHAHADHLGDLDALAQRLSFATWIDPGFERRTFAPYMRALAACHERHIPVKAARRGDAFTLGAFAGVEVLAPYEPFLTHTRSDVNANSVVLRVDHHATRGDVRVLFEGDAEDATEKRLLEAPAALHADVLKVAHHGSRYASSDALLSAVSPRLAVISCGVGNDYGHPHAPTLERLAKHHAEVARTDVEGTITVTSGDMGLTWAPERTVSPELLRVPGKGTHAEAAP